MDIKKTRRLHLLKAIAKHGTIAELAAVSECDESYISQIKNATRDMGHRFARKMEKGLGLKEGSFDSPLPGMDPDKNPRDELYLLSLELDDEDLKPHLDGIRRLVEIRRPK